MNIKVGQKYNDDLPLINMLGLIANKSVQLEWEELNNYHNQLM